MSFNFYDEWFDIRLKNPPVLEASVHSVFTYRMEKFLMNSYNMRFTLSHAIADATFARMSDLSLHYHTPVHVLAIFDFAAKHGIKLQPWEELAIWFHDSVYDVNNIPGDNERLSADFMYAMVRPYVKDAYDASAAIVQTSCHLEPTCPEKYAKILDLDMCGFATPRPLHKTITQAIFEEYHYCGATLTTFNEGRKKFLSKLLAKGPIYRTAAFAQFEPLAQENIRLDLEELDAGSV